MRSLKAANPKPRHADLPRIAQFQGNADSIDRAVQPFNLSVLQLTRCFRVYCLNVSH